MLNLVPLGTQYLFLRGFTAAFGGAYYSVKCLLDTVQKRRLAQGPSRSLVMAQQLGFIRPQGLCQELSPIVPCHQLTRTPPQRQHHPLHISIVSLMALS
jgi:hypothetical protein